MFQRPRLIPCLTMIDRGLVKTIKFREPRYLGDPVNSVRIFNGKGVDELCILDIRATTNNKAPDFEYLRDIASEAFMPLSYGGGITRMSEIEKLFYIGYEKVIINSAFANNPSLIKEAAITMGNQSIVVSLDIKTELLGKKHSYINGGKVKLKEDIIDLAKKAESLGAGEILLTSITKDGSMKGYDIPLIKSVADSVSIPVIASGGAGSILDIKSALHEGGAHAIAAGSLYVYYGKQKGILITAPSEEELFNHGIYSQIFDV